MDLNSELSIKWISRPHCLKLTEFIARQHNPNEGYPKRLLEIIQGLPSPLDFTNGPWLAGGSLRRLFDGTEGESDFDFFFRDEEQLNAFHEMWKPHSKMLYDNELNTTLLVQPFDPEQKPFKAQLIKFYFYSPEDVINWFDYTNCQFITDGNTLMVGEYTLYDIGRKQLRLHNIHHAASTVRRMLKYARQGYTVCDGTINDILKTVAAQPELINEAVRYID